MSDVAIWITALEPPMPRMTSTLVHASSRLGLGRTPYDPALRKYSMLIRDTTASEAHVIAALDDADPDWRDYLLVGEPGR